MNRATIARPHTIFDNEAEASKVAAAMQKDDQDWKYVVSVDPKGSVRAIVKVYDEAGNFIQNI